MMSPGGTPLVAVESGYAQFKTTSLGGNSIWVNGASGTRYFYAHLSAWEGSSRDVSQGEVIGYVGHRQHDGEPPALRSAPRRRDSGQPVSLRPRRLLTSLAAPTDPGTTRSTGVNLVTRTGEIFFASRHSE